MSVVEIRLLGRLPLDQLDPLRLEAQAQGFEHLERLVQEHEPNRNRFDRAGRRSSVRSSTSDWSASAG